MNRWLDNLSRRAARWVLRVLFKDFHHEQPVVMRIESVLIRVRWRDEHGALREALWKFPHE